MDFLGQQQQSAVDTILVLYSINLIQMGRDGKLLLDDILSSGGKNM